MPLRGSGVIGSWQLSQRYVDTENGLDRPRWRTTLSRRFSSTLQMGLEINAAVGEVGFIGNWFAQRETDTRPAIIFGTSSDRIGTREGTQAFFATFSKQLGRAPVAPYFSINYSGADRRINYPFGASIALGDQFILQPMYDGQRGHTLLTWFRGRQSISLIYVWNRRFGISFGYTF